MWRRSIAALVSASLALIATSALAGEGNGVIYGAGNSSCGRWLEDRKSDDWFGKGQWMLGFISAASVFDVVDLKRSDSAAFAAFADKYCTEHPLDQFSDAVRALLLELRTG